MHPSEDTIISFPSHHQLRELCVPAPSRPQALGQLASEQKYKFRMVSSEGKRQAASLLIQERYAWRGYSVEGALPVEPNVITLAADCAGATIATMTVCVDQGGGLPADQNFGAELDALRMRGCRLSEPSRLAIDGNVSKRVFASLIHIAHIFAHKMNGASDWIIEVNPRHVAFYKRMLGFRHLSSERMCTRVNAPAVLMRLECQYMEEKIRKHGGHMEQLGRERSIYPYFFSHRDESDIANRLTGARA